MLRLCFLAALGVLSGTAAVSDELVVQVNSLVSVHRDHTATLPCWLNPVQSAENLEVRWYRDDSFDSPIMLYREQREQASPKASFGKKDATSGGLQSGDVSLKLVNVTVEDAGDYTCYVSSSQGYDRALVHLTVTATGGPLFLSVVRTEDDEVKVSCESRGWYPKPVLRWSNQKQALQPKSLTYSSDSSGLVSVHSWLLVTDSSEVSCSVGLSDGDAKETRVSLDVHQEVEPSVAGWVAFAVLLVAALAALVVFGFLYYRKRAKKAKSGSDPDEENLTENLLPKVNVTLDETDNRYLRCVDRRVVREDVQAVFPDGDKVTCLTAIKGNPGFSSGKHYWEVSLGKPNIGLKKSWWLGVTSRTEIPLDKDFIPTASEGFWFLSSSPDKADILQFNGEPKVFLHMPSPCRPQTVGVLLNYNDGALSFFNVEGDTPGLIFSIRVKFKGEVFPFFNPGKGDTSPMAILHVNTEPNQSADGMNDVKSEDKTADP
ncbi:uncharacterized protein V6R79_003910 [Siganus canaliculatus]